MKRIIPLILILAMILPLPVSAAPSEKESQSVTIPGGPTFWIHNVQRDDTVTISITNYPKGKHYRVLLGRIGNLFGQGIFVGTTSGGTGKDFLLTFDIPKKLWGSRLLGIKLYNGSDGSYGYTVFANLDDWNSTMPLSLTPVDQSSAQTVGTSVAIFQGPTFWIQDVRPQKDFIIKLSNWNGADKYKVFVSENVEDAQKYWVGTVDESKAKWSFTRTYDIPIYLWKADQIKVTLEGQFSGHTGSTAFTQEKNFSVVAPAGQYTWTYINTGDRARNTGSPFTNILNVVRDAEVTIQTFNFPDDTDFVVTMGPLGSQGIGGIVIGTQNSGEGGSFIVTYPIPGQLRGQDYIAVRFQSATSAHFAYDFFQNETGYSSYTGSASAFSGDWILPPGTFPSTLVNEVVAGTSVTVSGFNFTKNDTYTVRMGPIGTQGVGGAIVANINIDGTGTFTQTFTIPPALVGQSQIAIRFESHNTSYYAYDWFWNQ